MNSTDNTKLSRIIKLYLFMNKMKVGQYLKLEHYPIDYLQRFHPCHNGADESNFPQSLDFSKNLE
jgi:hypothetical protein